MISRPHSGKIRTELSQVGFPGKQTWRWGFAQERFPGESSRGEKEEAGPGRGRGWFAIQSQQKSMLVPCGAPKLG